MARRSLYVFTAEIHIVAHLQYLRDVWNWLDFTVVVSGWVASVLARELSGDSNDLSAISALRALPPAAYDQPRAQGARALAARCDPGNGIGTAALRLHFPGLRHHRRAALRGRAARPLSRRTCRRAVGPRPIVSNRQPTTARPPWNSACRRRANSVLGNTRVFGARARWVRRTAARPTARPICGQCHVVVACSSPPSPLRTAAPPRLAPSTQPPTLVAATASSPDGRG